MEGHKSPNGLKSENEIDEWRKIKPNWTSVSYNFFDCIFIFQLNDGPQVNLRRLQTDTIESTGPGVY